MDATIKEIKKWTDHLNDREQYFRDKKVNENPNPVYNVEWTEVDGVKVKRIENSNYVAVPSSGRKNSKEFFIVDLNQRYEAVCFLKKDEVNQWLINKYKTEIE